MHQVYFSDFLLEVFSKSLLEESGDIRGSGNGVQLPAGDGRHRHGAYQSLSRAEDDLQTALQTTQPVYEMGYCTRVLWYIADCLRMCRKWGHYDYEGK